jgi:Leucine-rich repeat (LRR) protein
VLSDDIAFTSTNGQHRPGKGNNDVLLLDFSPHDDDGPKRDIRFIPSGIGAIFPNLRILYVQSCKIKALSRKNFRGLNELATMSLTENEIAFIDEDTFYDVPKLYSLRVNGNRLKTVPLNLFVNSPRLQHFIFAGNLIEELDGDQLFRNSPNLRSIDLEDNQLRKVKVNLAKFKELVKVDLENNKCVHARFGKGSTKTIAELQEIINTSC